MVILNLTFGAQMQQKTCNMRQNQGRKWTRHSSYDQGCSVLEQPTYLEMLNQLNQLETCSSLIKQANDIRISQSWAKKTYGSSDWIKSWIERRVN